MSIRESGASWDFQEYQPHVTLSYGDATLALEKVEPFRGKLRFGPEIFSEIDENWHDRAGRRSNQES